MGLLIAVKRNRSCSVEDGPMTTHSYGWESCSAGVVSHVYRWVAFFPPLLHVPIDLPRRVTYKSYIHRYIHLLPFLHKR